MTTPVDPGPAQPQEPGIIQRAEGWFRHDEPELKVIASDAASLLAPYATHVGVLSLVARLLAAAAGGGPLAALVPEAVSVAEMAVADLKAALAPRPPA